MLAVQKLSPFPCSGDEDMGCYAVLTGERYGMFNFEGGAVSRKDELIYVLGYYRGRKQEDRASAILAMLAEETRDA